MDQAIKETLVIKTFKALALGLSVLLSVPSYAATPTEKLATCLVDALNGKERKQLVKFMFFALASHPELSSASNITAEERDAAERVYGGLMTRLITENCPSETKAAYEFSPLAVQEAFQMIAQVAMAEITADPKVTASLSSYMKYADVNKIASTISVPSR
ncbi:hypothetical protein J2W49_002930 [Hydrogenophaga palleronii]|uniref:Uncharacterized protein n=1 Tax=Hydrogenophaga palleronii TaxID=65655 RepID=A0ABU1WNU1_9BURK|nr:hypothetical protein [Hydrogenophaga palleronii]MDR7150957.1 hypothetical protein [Hydrogenophaga palleronii]